ncbi:MAG: VCBS repeat-containing protein [Candidatus Marinimicrobia bacterium]|nr:VCBS repeat-containing protein [Candidatus Neomarinimicrobiota bacterium]
MSQLKVLLFVSFWLLILGTFPAGWAVDKDSYFEVYKFRINGCIKDYVIEDINGDGLKDIMVFYQRLDLHRNFCAAIYYQSSDGFKSRPDQNVRIDSSVIILDLANIDPSPALEIVAIEPEGVFCYTRHKDVFVDVPELLIKEESVFRVPGPRKLLWDFSEDFDNDGIDEMVIPGFGGLKIYKKGVTRDDYRLNSLLHVCPDVILEESQEVAKSISPIYRIPKMLFMDYNNDGKRDILVIERYGLKIFFQKGVPMFTDENSAQLRLGFGYCNTSAISVGTRGDSKEKIGIGHIVDLNNDGFVDLVVNKLQNRGSMFNPKKQFQIYLGRRDEEHPLNGSVFEKVPDQIITSMGFQIASQLVDVNNDGMYDIVIPYVDLNIYRLISLFLRGKIRVDVVFYIQDGNDGLFKPENYRRSFKVVMGFGGRARVPVFCVDGDFNGDGYVDLLTNEGGDLLIFYGKMGKEFSERPEVKFPVGVLAGRVFSVTVARINDDLKSDVVIVPEAGDANSDTILLLVTG